MSKAAEFIDLTLQREATWERANAQSGSGDGLRYYGASVGAVRGAVRDAGRKFRPLTHDQVTALASELWNPPVFERRLAAVVLLQSNLGLLRNSDLTRLEGFVRGAGVAALADPLAVDVIGPLIAGLTGHSRNRAESILDRWTQEPEPWLHRAALLAPVRAVRAGGGDVDGLVRRARAAVATADSSIVREAVEAVHDVLAKAETAKSPGNPGLSLCAGRDSNPHPQ